MAKNWHHLNMPPGSPPVDKETRFAYLLNPIRDLAKNWDIDLASYLDEYLLELENVSLTFDGGKTTMNFAQAAMLIQGSTCVYSRKVEFLYNLVMQMLDLLHAKRKLTQPSSIDEQGKDKDASYLGKQDEDEFLCLDDIDENQNIDLKEDCSGKKKPSFSFLKKTPPSLLPLEDAEKGDIHLYSKTGDVLGNKNDFKVNSSILDGSGALLLDSAHFRFLVTDPPCPLGEVSLSCDIPEEPPVPMELDKRDDCDSVVVNSEPPVEYPNEDIENEAPLKDSMLPMIEDIKQENTRYELRKKKEEIVEPPNPLPVINKWKREDSHDEIPDSKKLLKKGKIIKIPEELAEQLQAKRKRKEVTKEKLTPISIYTSATIFSHASKFPRNVLKVPSFEDFADLFWRHHKHKIARFQKYSKMLKEEEMAIEIQNAMEVDDNGESEPAIFGDDPEAFDDAGNMSEDDIPNTCPASQEMKDACAAATVKGEDDNILSSYEELVKNHVEIFLASAQQYAHVTELAQRVNEWEEKILPKLEEDIQHGPYDIHVYGSKVLDTFASNSRKQTLRFGEIVAGKERYEVARYFLATLQLANNYNIEISSGGELENGMDTMAVTILSKKRHHEDLEDYTAPSLKK